MQVRLDALYNELDSIEDSIVEAEQRIDNIRRQKINGENVYKYLLCFDRLYGKFTDAEKKEFISSFVESVEIYESELPDGRFLKRIRFHFPVYFKGKEVQEISWDEDTTVETVVLLSKGIIDSKKVRVEFSLEDMYMSGFRKGATYQQIKDYVLDHTGLKVSTLYIAQVKQKYGIIERENYNKPKFEDTHQPQCPPDKEAAIVEALRHFGMI